MKWLRRIILGDLTEEELELLQTIKDNDIRTARVVGRGAVVCDTEEVINSRQYKEQCELARQVVNNA